MPLITNDHHSQLPATPYFTVSPVTAGGGWAAKVGPTTEVPASHHGIERPVRKYSVAEALARREKTTPMPSETTKYARITAQSTAVRITQAARGTRRRRTAAAGAPGRSARAAARRRYRGAGDRRRGRP